MKIEYRLKDIPKICPQLFEVFGENKVIAFNAEMGVGKTTLIKELVSFLGVDNQADSPTYSIVNEYLSNEGATVFHFDCYRIENEEEALDIGIEEYLYSGNLCFIEWPENILNLLPDNTVCVQIESNLETSVRTLTISK